MRILFRLDCPLGQHGSRLDFIEREQMHRPLIGCLMAERPAHRFAIHRNMCTLLTSPLRGSTTGFLPTAPTGFRSGQAFLHHSCYFLIIQTLEQP